MPFESAPVERIQSAARDAFRNLIQLDTGLKWGGELLARLRATGKAMPIMDSLIAATTLTHDLPN